MKLFKFLAVTSAVSATEEVETDDVFLNQCQAAYFESQGIKIDPAMIIEDDCDKGGDEDRAAVGSVTKWTNMWDPAQNKFIVPYYYPEGYEHLEFGGHTGAMSIEGIDASVAHFETHTCIKMKRITEAEKDEYVSVIRVDWDNNPENKCWSFIGRSNGDSIINMRPDCYTWWRGTTVNHEFMHRLGFLHEHSRPDRDDYVAIHPNVVGTWNYRKLTYGPSAIGQWEDLSSPYDFNSILHYYSGTEPDGLPTIGVAGNPSVPAPVDRTFPMSEQDAIQLNAYHGCEMNNKCADAGPDRCGGPFHGCVNRPIGYECVCADGFDLVTGADGVQTCVPSGVDPTPDPTSDKLVQDMVVMIDGSGSYRSYRHDACGGLKTIIRRGIEIEEERDEIFRFGYTLYSDRTFNSGEFTRTYDRVFDLAHPLEDVSEFVKDDGTVDEAKLDDVYDECVARLGSMWYGGDWEEDVLSGAIWTRSANAMKWSKAQNTAKWILVATDVHYWTKETKSSGSVTPPTSLLPDQTLDDLYIFGNDPNQESGYYTYYPFDPAVDFLFCSDLSRLDKMFVSVKSSSSQVFASYDAMKRNVEDQCERGANLEIHPVVGSVADQFVTLAAQLEEFAAAAATSATGSTAVNECDLGTDDCHAEAACTDTTSGYTCACNDGFHGDGFVCTAVDPCETLTCDGAQEFCRNGACTCNDGYQMVDGSCVDADECGIIAESSELTSLGDTLLVPCAQGATCINTEGSYECICDGKGWEEIDGVCVNKHAWKQVNTQYTIRMNKVNGHLARLIDNLEKTKFTRNYIRKMLKKIQQLDDNTNEDKLRCDGSDAPDDEEAGDLQVFDGTTNCKLASQINSALVSASRKWACTRAGFDNAAADRLVRHFNKLHRQFKKRMCSE